MVEVQHMDSSLFRVQLPRGEGGGGGRTKKKKKHKNNILNETIYHNHTQSVTRTTTSPLALGGWSIINYHEFFSCTCSKNDYFGFL